ncbi:MAG: hypothetical protein EXQ58_03095 [Acidobacteria bacterium]|nr:hypothetical protein [Acidobacteriota bacterium]
MYTPYSGGYKMMGLKVYFAGKLIRSKQTDDSGNVSDVAVVLDRVGSVRKRVNVYAGGTTVSQQYLNYPFGKELSTRRIQTIGRNSPPISGTKTPASTTRITAIAPAHWEGSRVAAR